MPALLQTGHVYDHVTPAMLCCLPAQPVDPASIVRAAQEVPFIVDAGGLYHEPIVEDSAPKNAACCLFWSPPAKHPKEKLPPNYNCRLVGIQGKKNIGLVLETFLNSCVVTGIRPGSVVTNWNQNCPHTQEVRVGDVLEAVNGLTGSAGDLLETIEALEERPVFDTLTLSFKRAHLLDVGLSRNHKQLGIHIELDNAEGVIITEVLNGGALADWNQNNEVKVKSNDRILAVNGLKTNSQISSLLQEASEMRMQILSTL
jgi:hypothetical protein